MVRTIAGIDNHAASCNDPKKKSGHLQGADGKRSGYVILLPYEGCSIFPGDRQSPTRSQAQNLAAADRGYSQLFGESRVKPPHFLLKSGHDEKNESAVRFR